MTKDIRIFILIIFLVGIFFSPNLLADDDGGEGVVIFQMTDPVGDDWGPGTYTYPRFRHFDPYEGLLDLTKFVITDLGEEYLFEFTLTKITDPWRSRYGFSHPLIQLYIDNDSGGSTELFRPGARVQLDPDAPWNVMLHITGWWVRVFRPENRDEFDSMQIIWNDVRNPFDLESAIVKVESNVIKIQIPKAEVGDLSQARLFLLVGAFDSFGHDHFREVKANTEDWSFGGNVYGELGPRILDILVPEGMSQEEILTPKDGEMVVIPYLRVGKETIIDEAGINTYLVLAGMLVLLILVALVFKMRGQKPPISQ